MTALPNHKQHRLYMQMTNVINQFPEELKARAFDHNDAEALAELRTLFLMQFTVIRETFGLTAPGEEDFEEVWDFVRAQARTQRMAKTNPVAAAMDDLIFGFMPELVMESDRGAALVAAADLEIFLADLLRNFLIDDPKLIRELFQINAPLSTFDGKLRLAFCLGLISPMEYHDLKCIQWIRNRFAHERRYTSFEDPDIRDRCRRLQLVRRTMALAGNIPGLLEGQRESASALGESRMLFTNTVTILSLLFQHRILHPEPRRAVRSDIIGESTELPSGWDAT